MTRRITALLFLSRLMVVAQQPTPAGGPNPAPPPVFSKADMFRLIEDLQKVIAANTIAGTQILAKRFSADLEKAAKVPPAQRAAAMEKATEDYRKRVDAFNQDGMGAVRWREGTSPIVNPLYPELGYWRNLLDSCVEGRAFATRTESGMPVFQQVTSKGGAAVIHTFTPGLPLEETTPSPLSAQALCPSLVRNAVKASPPGIAEAPAPPAMPKAMQICVSACASLEWADGHYRVLGRDGKAAITYTVESFTAGSVILHRTELQNSPANGLTAIYRGSLDAGGTSAQGTVDFSWPRHAGFPHSGTWKAAWGPSLAESHPVAQKKPEERGDAEEAQARSAKDEQAQRFSAGVMGFLAAMLGVGPAGESGGSDGDPSGRIERLQNRINELNSQCGGNPRDPSGACARAREMRGDLSDAYGDLNREIDSLKVQMGQLQKDCAAHVAGACANLNRVKGRLESDIELRLSSIF